MNSVLINLAARVGAPLVERALAGRIGQDNVDLAKTVLATVATYAGLSATEVENWAGSDDEAQRDTIEQAVLMAEADMPELIALHQSELEGKMRLLEAEQREPFWAWAWRPAGMWALGFFWFYNIALLHWLNAYFKIALPPVDFAVLLQISALYMSLYMGGHTVKDVMAKWAGGRARA